MQINLSFTPQQFRQEYEVSKSKLLGKGYDANVSLVRNRQGE